ncbi:SDR family oxidoreductase [Nostocoides sp. Soil756]|jgi:NAD(P)-dependent dehydrogenase (short-subunit alcohol dehydrogenase family)|uniref:SDR family NAD(P)-dependent oxidoreductase n=1 Tax=Nostocoides sp. Soil756 TaxID=1736399 RepID=UPI0006F41E40|nr:SDR family oxidoreductase [Tetrasphaera sp. Soil756]KRE60977.1 3-oxoacyl-ACP reductase [Tetrasphaera sp. Soil756]
MTPTTLDGQVALVTGASQGIGAYLVAALAGQGCTVVGLARSADRLGATLDDVARSTGARTLALAADVTSRASVDDAVATALRQVGPVDVVVNAAGLVDRAEVPLWESAPEDWWEVVTSHVRGAQLVARAVLPGMVARGRGRLVNLASGMGTRAEPEYSAYSVGKAAQIRLTECLEASLEGSGVHAFNIAPGLVRTEMTAGMPRWDGHTNWTPPERVAELVLAVAGGGLDAWAGRFLRAGVDLPEAVAALTPSGPDRQLRMRSYGAEDPMA